MLEKNICLSYGNEYGIYHKYKSISLIISVMIIIYYIIDERLEELKSIITIIVIIDFNFLLNYINCLVQ